VETFTFHTPKSDYEFLQKVVWTVIGQSDTRKITGVTCSN